MDRIHMIPQLRTEFLHFSRYSNSQGDTHEDEKRWYGETYIIYWMITSRNRPDTANPTPGWIATMQSLDGIYTAWKNVFAYEKTNFNTIPHLTKSREVIIYGSSMIDKKVLYLLEWFWVWLGLIRKQETPVSRQIFPSAESALDVHSPHPLASNLSVCTFNRH